MRALLRLAQHLRAHARLHHARSALEVLATLVPAALLHAVHRDVPGSAERREQQILAQHPVLLATDQDLAGQQQDVSLAAVLRDQVGHAGLRALHHREGAASAGLVERQDLEGGGAFRVPPDQPEHRQTRLGDRRADRELPEGALEVGADLAGQPGIDGAAAVGQDADAVGQGWPRRDRGGAGRAQELQKRASQCIHIVLRAREAGNLPA